MRLLLFILIAGSCFGQEVTTNYVVAADFIREVDGRAYNINLSKVWSDISFEPSQTFSNGIVAMKMRPHYKVIRSSSSGNGAIGGYTAPASSFQDGYTEEYQIFIRNTKPVAEGQVFNARALKVGATNLDGHTYEMWDVGTPHVVAIVRTNPSPSIVKTNK